MKSKLIITYVCIGMLGSTSSYASDEEATTVNTESASQQSKNDKGQDSAAKSAKSDDNPSGKRADANEKAAKAQQKHDRAQLTNADCFPKTAPAGVSMWAATCVGLANSHPDVAFTKHDYQNMPEDCKPLVNAICR